jgi:hypothetical protein
MASMWKKIVPSVNRGACRRPPRSARCVKRVDHPGARQHRRQAEQDHSRDGPPGPERSPTTLRSDGARSSRLQPVVDGPFGHVGPAGIEPVMQEVLAELEVDHGGPAAVLLHAEGDESFELLGLHGVVAEVVAGNGLVLLVEDDGDVGLVGQRGRPTEVVEAAMAEPLPP